MKKFITVVILIAIVIFIAYVSQNWGKISVAKNRGDHFTPVANSEKIWNARIISSGKVVNTIICKVSWDKNMNMYKLYGGDDVIYWSGDLLMDEYRGENVNQKTPDNWKK